MNKAIRNSDIINFIKKYNNQCNNNYIKSDNIRIFYVIKNKNIIDVFNISEKHNLASARKIAKELFLLVYNKTYELEYYGKSTINTVDLEDYTNKNEYFEYCTSLYIQ